MSEKNSIRVSEWLEAFNQSEAMSREVPKGWKTVQTIAKETGRSLDATGKLVRALLIQDPPGAEMRKFLIQTKSRGWYPTPHYRVIKSKP